MLKYFYGKKKDLNSAVDLCNEFTPKFSLLMDDERDQYRVLLKWRGKSWVKEVTWGEIKDPPAMARTAFLMMEEFMEMLVREGWNK